jgi:triosephosphate isomerase
MRKKFVAGNWKMNKTASEAKVLAEELKAEVGSVSDRRVLVAPNFTALHAVQEVIESSSIILGAQNMSDAESGAHTGETSVHMLKDLGVEVVILGHSERRAIYGESDELIRKKVDLALAEGLEVILCVGETLEEREAGKVEEVVGTQVRAGMKGLADISKVTIAYEPVWAIGTGKTATPEDADAVHAFIRTVIAELFDSSLAESQIIQYGGSVKPENAKELLNMPNIDGALVGGASLKAETFVPIVRYDA